MKIPDVESVAETCVACVGDGDGAVGRRATDPVEHIPLRYLLAFTAVVTVWTRPYVAADNW